ncbi:hypothetical protein ACFPMF_01830 [Larkinella bovis]|uniref:Uncharacterized protein n=1 Tax=Larkinella bovis TaxID=683041 RepID=A0ABW0I6J3_9BACT
MDNPIIKEITPQTDIVLAEVRGERERQEAKWGQQNRRPHIYSIILNEEVGEVNKAICEWYFGDADATLQNLKDIRSELIQVAAVAVAMVESMDRNEFN